MAMKNFEVEELKPVLIRGNFDEMQTALANMMQAYAGLEVTEENIPERKKDVATLRKMKAAIDEKRKEVKREYEKPLKSFETKCKELTGIIDTEISRINYELSEYEEKRIEEKRALILQLYVDNMSGYEEYLPLGVIYDPKWENKTCTEKTIISDMQTAKLRVKTELSTIKTAAGEFTGECLEWYKNCGCDLAATMRRLEDLRSAREAVLRGVSSLAEEVRDKSTKTAEKPQNERETHTFRVFNEQDRNSVKAYLEMMGIEYEEV